MSNRLDGKIALITGIGSGIGRAAAVLFAREGARIAGCDLNAEQAEETARLVKDAGGEILSKGNVDAADKDQVTAWVEEAAARFGRIDILYNNAGWNVVGPFDAVSDDDWRLDMRSEVDVVYYPTRAAWPHLIAAGGGSIINTSSIIARRAMPVPMTAHGVAKGAVASFAPHLAVEGGPHGIRVNTISPGLTRTAQTEPLLSAPDDATRGQVKTSPLGRVGTPEDVAAVALFLASDESSYVTGVNITVDGGQTLAMGMFFS